MSLVVSDIGMSIDGYVAGTNQSLEEPLGMIEGRPAEWVMRTMHDWMFTTPEENQAEVDAIIDAGAFIMGRNMFGPIRGEHDPDWRGWWGEDPPYHGPVFVLTHHPRDPLPMDGGTTFHFVTEGIDVALERARAAAGERNVSVAGGASTVNQFLAAGLIDELRVHIAPLILGAGERLFDGVPTTALQQVSSRAASKVTHVVYRPVR
jgi:dihydrofolate reductase